MPYFHFTLGPVQSFVGQARRTKDFWAGSFLLSWLSGVAMVSVEKQGGSILFPQADPDFIKAIKNGAENGPKQGTIPNRFKAEVGSGFDRNAVCAEVQQAWKELADQIYKEEIAAHILTDTKAIWDRQVAHFWDMSWVLTTEKNDHSGLDRRKNWRSQCLPEEPGLKCSLMGDWQELSGIIGVGSKDREEREQFWKQFSPKLGLDSIEHECLCAMAYIKRRFNVSFNANFSVELNGWQAHGWAIPQSVPSVPRLAAAHWYATVLGKEHEHGKASSRWQCFFNEAYTLSGLPEKGAAITCIENIAVEKPDYKYLDGNVFFEDALNNANIFKNQNQAQKVRALLTDLTRDHGKPSPFYAILAMDGDHLGKQMSAENKQDPITKGLAVFTNAVPGLVREQNGFLIYAGGDDVLALTPLEDALACAKAIQKCYQKCFANKPEITTSISAAIIYTHITTPLANILHDAHALLDKIAKDGAGRDAFAVRVVKGSGQVMQWAKKWATADIQDTGSAGTDNVDVFHTILKNFRALDTDTGQQFSSKFFFKIRQRFDLLYPKGGQPGHNPLTDEQCLDLMAMEYQKSSGNTKMTMDAARQAIQPLMILSFDDARGRITADAALFLRFLVQKSVEGGLP